MKQPHTPMKLAVLVSSIMFASGFVAYSAGALNWLTSDNPPRDVPTVTSPESEMVFSGSKSVILVAPAERQLLGGSKSDVPLVSQPPLYAPEPLAAEPAQSIMVGSKSPAIRPLISPPPSTPAPASKASSNDAPY